MKKSMEGRKRDRNAALWSGHGRQREQVDVKAWVRGTCRNCSRFCHCQSDPCSLKSPIYFYEDGVVSAWNSPARVQQETSACEELWICKNCLSKEGIKQEENLNMLQWPSYLHKGMSSPFSFLPCCSVLIPFLEEKEKKGIPLRANCKTFIQGRIKEG